MDSDEEFKNKMADAVYHDLIELKRLKRDVFHAGWLFPYGGEVYRAARVGGPLGPWAVRNVKPDASGQYPAIITNRRTRTDAIKDSVRHLHGTKCAAGYTIGQDSCPHCDAETEAFENKYQ